MNRQEATFIVPFIAGLAMSVQALADVRETIGRLGVSILVGSFFFLANTPLQRGKKKTFISLVLVGVLLVVFSLLIRFLVFGGK